MSQLMSAMNLWLFPTLALVFFLLAFLLIMARLFAPGRAPELARAASLPLDDGLAATPPTRPEVHA